MRKLRIHQSAVVSTVQWLCLEQGRLRCCRHYGWTNEHEPASCYSFNRPCCNIGPTHEDASERTQGTWLLICLQAKQINCRVNACIHAWRSGASCQGLCLQQCGWQQPWLQGSYLVDPASSHMLVSKIKPCMSKYKLLYTVKLRMAH